MTAKRRIGMYRGEFLPVYLGQLDAMVTASMIVDELHVVVSYDEKYEKEFFKGAGMKPISVVRRSWCRLRNHQRKLRRAF